MGKSSKTALVTGASAGIGVDLAECFADDGYDVILAARTESVLREVADRLANTYAITGDKKYLDRERARGSSPCFRCDC